MTGDHMHAHDLAAVDLAQHSSAARACALLLLSVGEPAHPRSASNMAVGAAAQALSQPQSIAQARAPTAFCNHLSPYITQEASKSIQQDTVKTQQT